ncbi:BQ5605_C004g03108 [Microbotryum silenes-dioicae]|uniref:BQ5605_C004g03108 protein n=1 Tax=Microbotryum silenes-dioicae TaxID=796604 RepID=A0A2X0MEA9_9BASI|nr:BQ5605_C004g03108 [Microbotryum silenes-dioicae]
MPVRFCTLFVSLERQCLLPLHSRNFSTLLLPAMTTASTSTNDHAALSSTESPAATIGGAAGVHVAPLLPPVQLSGAPDTTAGTTYDGALFGISAEMIKWAKDRKDSPMSCLSRHQQVKQDARYSYVLLIKEAVDPMTTSIIVGGAQSPSEMFDRHFESVAMNWSKIKVFGPFDQSIMAQVTAALNVAMKWAELAAEHQSSCARAMERPVDDLIEARGRIQAMEEATLGGEDWKPSLPLLKSVAVAPAVVVVTSVVPLSAVPRAAACNNYNSWRVCITNLSPLSCRAVTSASRPRRYLSGIASSASVLWFRGRIPHRSRFLTSAITELPMHGVGRASIEPVAAGSKEDVPFVPSMPAPGPSPAPETSARMRIMAREVDSFHDAMYEIVPPLDAPAFKANIKALGKVAHVAPYLAAIPKQIRKGFDFGIKDPPSERHIAKNAPLTEEQQLVMDGEMERMLDLGYIAGPYDKDELEAAFGPFRMNPISYVPTRSEVESVTGPLRQCIANGERKAVSRARRLDRRTYDQLEYWRRFLSSEGPFSTSFEALLIPSKLALALDACMHGLGIVVNGYSAYFALPEGWTDLPSPRHSVSITNAEAWAVEALAEAALRM